MHDYKIGVKFQDGTAWLRGQVSSEEQMKTAIALVSKMQGITRVVNNLTINASDLATTPALHQPESVAKLPTARTESDAKLQAAANTFAPEQLPRVGSMESPQSYGGSPSSSAQRLQNAIDAAAREQQARQNPASSAAYVSNGAAAAARPVSASAEEPAPSPEPIPRRAVRPVPVAYAPAEATMPQSAGVPSPMPMASGAPMPMASGAPPLPMAAAPIPAYAPNGGSVAPARFDHPHLPNYAWPSYAAHPNYAAVTYPRQYSATAWPYIGPFYPYPQVPLGWRKVTLEWKDGWWFLDFKDRYRN
jgi:Flp pilus assembly protein TadG